MPYYANILLVWNIVVMLLYGTDKILAKAHRRRISEFSLLLSAFLLGGAGAMFGMVFFNHKTSKLKFRIFVPVAAIVELWAIYLIGMR